MHTCESVKTRFTCGNDRAILPGMPSPFGALLVEIYSGLGLSQTACAELLQMSQPNLSKCIAGHPRVPGPPLDRLEAWADALGLPEKSEIRERFKRLGQLAHAPPYVRDLVEGLESDLAKARQQHALLLEKHTLLLEEVARITAGRAKPAGKK